MQIEKQITITYRWWNNEIEEISSGHMKALEETALDHIAIMLKIGFTSGELKDNIHMYNTDPEDGIEYHGHWEQKQKTL